MKRLIIFVLSIISLSYTQAQQRVELNNQFTDLQLSGNIVAELIEDSVCRIEATSYDLDIQRVKWSQKGDLLKISTPEGVFDKGVVYLKIHVSNLQHLVCDGVKVESKTPLMSQNLCVYAVSSTNSINLNLDVERIEVISNGKNDIKLSGQAVWAIIKASMGAKIDALSADFENCDALSTGGSEVIVNVYENFNAIAKSKATIFYKGNPSSNIKTNTWAAVVPIPIY